MRVTTHKKYLGFHDPKKSSTGKGTAFVERVYHLSIRSSIWRLFMA